MGEGNIIRLNMFLEAVNEHLCDVKSNISIKGEKIMFSIFEQNDKMIFIQALKYRLPIHICCI